MKGSMESVKDYVLLMLGAPVVQVELTDQQLEACIAQAISDFSVAFSKALAQGAKIPDAVKNDLIQTKALIEAIFVLSRIRGKCKNMPNTPLKLDGKQLFSHAKIMLTEWNNKIKRILG